MKAVLLFAVAAALAFAGGYGFGRFEAPQGAGPTPAAPAETVAGGPYYVEAGQLVVPMLERGRTVAFILTQVTLEAGSADDALLVRRRLPHARSAMLEALFDLAGHGRFNGPAVDPQGVAAALLAGANGSLIGRETAQPIRAVLIDRLLRQDNTRL
ncbi:hypothetical protein JHL17_25895 [Azospirillum sp. YIM B02556]|uniref:Flagellar basal body-associated protein FliL n=1 Tax=Azospirillum endophyticum TaxID=2800326 RepID=A0ABS1FBY4_9PROT|nr:hypothetical protein [Azospirillum endophyticum]MBK1840843.1 hypothetical protein [Azospirillum endophyticum]